MCCCIGHWSAACIGPQHWHAHVDPKKQCFFIYLLLLLLLLLLLFYYFIILLFFLFRA